MQRITVGLIGNPNCGKSTLFNALTGANERTGNWAGVTVERACRRFEHQGVSIELVDLPGIYSLEAQAGSVDEKVALEAINSGNFDVILNLVDATNLERHLYLTSQLAELSIKLVVALNFSDALAASGIQIDENKLAESLKAPVVSISAYHKKGLKTLLDNLINANEQTTTPAFIHYPEALERALSDIQLENPKTNRFCALLKLEQLNKITLQDDFDIVVADQRYGQLHQIVTHCSQKIAQTRKNITQLIDRVVLHRIWGVPIFLGIMYLMFVFAINIGGVFQPFFDISTDTVFVRGLAEGLTALSVPSWLVALIASGIGKGINTTITFAPIIGALFIFLAFLESSGYMARAAFVMDRFMRAIGLPGKAFVPMIVGFGCNVPAVMAARTLENKRDRILTILMSPFMSCGARLAIYSVFVAAFFPRGGQNVIFVLYLIGILMAILTGLILRKSMLAGDPAPLIMEMPAYRIPTFKKVYRQAWYRLKKFLFKAGKFIIPICMLIGTLNTLNIDGSLNENEANSQSVLSYIGQKVTPIFSPLGIEQNNWPATVGLISGVLAKEVVVGTLNTLYTQTGHLTAEQTEKFSLLAGLKAALVSIPQGIAGLKDSFSNPIMASAPDHDVNQSVLGIMYKSFDGQIGAFAYLLFVLLYFPCVSTTAVMLRELSKAWTIFSVFWATGVAYSVSVIFYQAATFHRHMLSSTIWICSLLFIMAVVFFIMRQLQYKKSQLELASDTI